MVIIPAGSYIIGASDAEHRRENMYSDGDTAGGPSEGGTTIRLTLAQVAAREQPQTAITIDQPFALGRYEVTVRQYAAFIETTRHDSADTCRVYNDDGSLFVTTAGVTWRTPGFEQSDGSPAVCMSWHDAAAYAQWMADRTNQPYRLPTEAEWEYGARAGSASARHWGNDLDETCRFANVGDLDMAEKTGWRNRQFTCRDGFAFTAPVGRYHPNEFGLYDMLGNVWEFIEDCWHHTHADRPTDASVWRGSACAKTRMTKGGSWSHYPWGIRSAVRNRAPVDASYNTTGLRLARDLNYNP